MVVCALLVQRIERRKTFIGGSTKQLLMSSGQCRHGRNSCSKGQLKTNTLPRRTGCALARHKASPQPAEVVASFPVSAKHPKPQTTGLMRRVGSRMMPCKSSVYSNAGFVSNNPVPYHPWRYMSTLQFYWNEVTRFKGRSQKCRLSNTVCDSDFAVK
jgi:hypothetical protein